MRVLQAPPHRYEEAIAQARTLRCEAIAWTLGEPAEQAVQAARRAGLGCEAWLQVARDPEAVQEHPEWMHCPQHHEWLQRFPDYRGQHPALVAPYIGLNTQAAFDHALIRTRRLVGEASWAGRVWLADIQGPPMGCGCGNPCCRSWDNAPGPKLASTPYDRPEILFPFAFYTALASALPETAFVPVLCPECERAICLEGIEDPDGPAGTDLCRGIPCGDICTRQYFPRLLRAFRQNAGQVGLLLLAEALEKNKPVFGAAHAWVGLAHRHYGRDLIACIAPEDAGAFEQALILTEAAQDCWPVAPPSGYRAEVPPILCGYCAPGS
jgi:hypothetical protein